METQLWLNPELNKTTWGDGPWQEEHCDKIQFEDKHTGMPCLAVRSHFGSWCGYVGVTADHPLYGVPYSTCAKKPQCEPETDHLGNAWWECDHRPEAILDVHGGITFSGGCRKTDDPAVGICHVPSPGEPEDVYWFGYDCGHYTDTQPGLRATIRALGGSGAPFPGESYKTLTYVQAECATLCDQLGGRDFSEKHGLA